MKNIIGILPLIIYMGAMFFIPVGAFLYDGLNIKVLDILHTSIYIYLLLYTLCFCIVTSFITVAISTPIALEISFNDGIMAEILKYLIAIPLLLNPLAIILALIYLLGNSTLVSTILANIGIRNLLYSPVSVAMGVVYVSIPIAVYSLINSFEHIEYKSLTAARLFGATNTQIFWRIIYPLSKSGFAYSFLSVFIISSGYYIIPSLLGGGHVNFYSVVIEEYANQVLDWNLTSGLSLLMTGGLVGALFILRALYLVFNYVLKKG